MEENESLEKKVSSSENNTEVNQPSSLQPHPKKEKINYKILSIILGCIILLGGGIILYPKLFPKKEIKKEVVKKEDPCLKSPTKIYDAYKNAVVLVKHRYAYYVSIKGKKPIPLNIEDEELQQEVYGTGFFVDSLGTIMTNLHLTKPWMFNENDQYIRSRLKDKISSILPEDLPEEEQGEYLKKNWYTAYDEESEEQATDSVAIAKPITISVEDVKIIPKTVEISVILHNSNDDWLACNIIKNSIDKEIDLGILQLKSKRTPSSVNKYVNLDNAITNDAALKPGTKAVLIGYPMGLDLASTTNGIKVQMYDGEINKESDGISLQYNITSTHGASGSPVFDECGRLIAINYSGYDKAQGYNFGIVAKHSKELYHQE